MIETVEEFIKRRRAQILIHSCLYYEMDMNIVSDHVWQEWANELEQIQKENPDACKINFFDKEFADWTGSTGCHLPHRHPWVYKTALNILDIHRTMK